MVGRINRAGSRRKLWMVAAGVALLALVGAGMAWELGGTDEVGAHWIVKLNDVSVETAEFQLFVNDQRAVVFDYFQKTYKADVGEGFWTTRYGTETPMDKIKALAMKQLVPQKLEQMWAKQFKLIDDLSYSSFLSSLSKENKRRKDAIASHQVVYGPAQYDAFGYYSYLGSNRVSALKEKLAASDLKPSEDELKAAYSANLAQFKNPDTITVDKIVIPSEQGKGKTAAAEAKAKLDQGVTFEEVARIYGKAPDAKNGIASQTFSVSTARSDSELSPLVLESANALKAGQISSVIEEGGSFTIVRVVSKQEMGLASFEQMKEQLKAKVVADKYAVELQRRVDAAKIEWNASELEQLIVN
ncbi:peptidylprolyl isomerase [Paenibacillus oryzisoli]|uniref:peptidylprolyl isomerase n=1 Tax=Paenibacillus oryzisoli TaxID=1850517 RepID=UPI003D29BED5